MEASLKTLFDRGWVVERSLGGGSGDVRDRTEDERSDCKLVL